jgi:precorrin-2 dehydrogenase / sirohydrochlorin ferrochelatase
MMLYPVNLRIAGKSCLVIGGGNVGLRKIHALLSCGATVMVISPQVVSGIRALTEEGRVSWRRRGYLPGDLDGAFLVFAVTDNLAVQQQVAEEAERRGILLNIADDPERCDFQVPAKVRRGDLLLTVSTGGSSPALAKLIREQLEAQFDGDYGRVISLFARIRELVVDRSDKSDANRQLFVRLLDADLVSLVQTRQWARVEEVLIDELPTGTDIVRLMAGLMGEDQSGDDE